MAMGSTRRQASNDKKKYKQLSIDETVRTAAVNIREKSII
jgi:hypothetical protein